MARSSDPDSANSQFFIMFAPRMSLDGNYTVFGRVIGGMQFVDTIKRGEGDNGKVESEPSRIVKASIAGDVPGTAAAKPASSVAGAAAVVAEASATAPEPAAAAKPVAARASVRKPAVKARRTR